MLRSAAVASLVATSCARPSFPCGSNRDCDGSAAGVCEPTRSLCASVDPSCESGMRYGPVAGEASGECSSPQPKFEAVAWQLAHAPRVDGEIDELQLGPGLAVDGDFGVSGRVWVRWDSRALYLAARVRDPNVASEPRAALELWYVDGVEFLFDTAADGTEGRIPHSDDFKFVVTAANEVGWSWGGIQPTGAWDAPVESVVRLQATLNQSSDQDEGYTVEARLPWNAEFPRPTPGTRWRFNVKLNDVERSGAREALWKPAERFNFPSQAGVLDFLIPGRPRPKVETHTAGPSAQRYVRVSDLGDLVDDSPTVFRDDQPLDRLFDGCISRLNECRAASRGDGELEVSFDLERPRELGFARLFGDARGLQVTREWKLEVRDGARWNPVADAVLRDDQWSLLDLRGTTARHVRLRVRGVSGEGTEAAEFELFVRPSG